MHIAIMEVYMNNYSKKEIEIITYLSNRKDYVTAKELSLKLGYSIRSIKNYIKNINDLHKNTIQSGKKGYLYNLDFNYKEIENNLLIPQTKNERMKVILKEVLIHEKIYPIEDLANYLCISSETMINEIRVLNQKLANFQVKINMDDIFVYIDGEEKNKRNAISNFILTDIKKSVFNYHIIEKYYPDIDILTLQKDITSILEKNNYYLDDFSIFNLILHIIIVINRLQNNFIDQVQPREQEFISAFPCHVYKISKSICQKIESHISVSFAQTDIYDFAILLSTRLIKQEDNSSLSLFLTNGTNKDMIDLLTDIENSLKDTYHIHLDNDNLKLRFYVHIKNLILRIKNNIKINNPMINETKKHIYIYDIAIFIASIISKKYNKLLSEDEIAYIAIHLILSFNEEMTQNIKLQTLLICPNYSDMRKITEKNIKNIFHNDLLIKKITSTFPKKKDNQYDLILSTIEADNSLTYSYIKINPIFNNKDILTISKEVEKIKKERKKLKFKEELRYFLKKDFFYYSTSKTLTREDIFRIVSNDLVNKNYVPQNFKQKLDEREELYSSAYNNIAIPHPLEQISFQSAISVFMVPLGVLWNKNNKVNIIMTLALTKEDQQHFKRIFDTLTDIFVNNTFLNILLKQENYENFIDKLTELCEYE